jgi:outer membrane lipoprotein-sorting protein
MRRLRTLSTRRLYGIVLVVALLAATAGIAQAALRGSASAPNPKPLDRAVLDALRAPDIQGVSARVRFSNGLVPGGVAPQGDSPLMQGAEGRIWVAGDGRFRLELQSDSGDAQIVDDGTRLTVYDPASKTAYTLPSHANDKRAARGEKPTLSDVRYGLAKLAETWTLSGAQPGTTADRPTYTVRIAPKDDGGLLGAAELAWDAAKGVPLRAAVYAQGKDEPVLELSASHVQYGAIPSSTFSSAVPRGTKLTEIDPPERDAAGRPTHVRGVDAVQKRLDFELSAPDQLAGLPRTSVRLVRMGDENGALSTYGKGMGAVLVLQHRGTDAQVSDGDLKLPQINIDGATGTELATPLGTLVTFTRGGVSYIVAGSVPPVSAENAARGLR